MIRDQIAVSIEIPGIRNVAAIWYLKNGSFVVNPILTGPAARHARAWIESHAKHFRHYCKDHEKWIDRDNVALNRTQNGVRH